MSRTSKTARALTLSSLVQLMTSSVPKAADLLSSIRAHEITIGTANDAPSTAGASGDERGKANGSKTNGSRRRGKAD